VSIIIHINLTVGSKIIFVKNGKPMGVAFSDVFEGCYYPAVSIYMGGSVTANFGPDFKYPVSIDQLGITEEDIENATDNPEEQFELQQVKPCCDLAPGLLPVMSPPPGGEYPFSPPPVDSSKCERIIMYEHILMSMVFRIPTDVTPRKEKTQIKEVKNEEGRSELAGIYQN